MVEALKVLSYNVKGHNSPIKRKKMLTQLKQLHCQIAFIKESHLSDAEHRKLNRSWANQGRYILINGSVAGNEVSLLNAYAPNDNNSQFITKIFELILDKS